MVNYCSLTIILAAQQLILTSMLDLCYDICHWVCGRAAVDRSFVDTTLFSELFR